MKIIAELEAEKQKIEEDVKNVKNRKVGTDSAMQCKSNVNLSFYKLISITLNKYPHNTCMALASTPP